MTVKSLPIGAECLIAKNSIWLDHNYTAVVGAYYVCNPIQNKLNNSDVFWARAIRRGSREGMVKGLEVIYKGRWEELPVRSNTSCEVVKVLHFKIADPKENQREVFLISDEPKCEICKIKPQEKRDLCYECNKKLAYLLGNIKRKNEIPFSIKTRQKLIEKITGALKNNA